MNKQLLILAVGILTTIFFSCNPDNGGETQDSGEAVKTESEADDNSGDNQMDEPDTRYSEKGKQDAAANGELGEKVKKTLQDLLTDCEGSQYAKAASGIIYRGEDPNMVWKEPYNYDNEDDKPLVEKMCAKIQAILYQSREIIYKEFLVEEEVEGMWHIWLTEIRYEDGSVEEKAFAFLPYGEDRFALGDID